MKKQSPFKWRHFEAEIIYAHLCLYQTNTRQQFSLY